MRIVLFYTEVESFNFFQMRFHRRWRNVDTRHLFWIC